MKNEALLLIFLSLFTFSAYASNNISDIEIQIPPAPQTIGSMLSYLEKNYGILFSYIENDIPLDKPLVLKSTKMPLSKLLSEMFSATDIQFSVNSKQVILKKVPITYKIIGMVTDSANNEPMAGANIYIKGENLGTVSNSDGSYSIKLLSGEYSLVYSFIGFKDEEIKINLKEDSKLNVILRPSTRQIGEVKVTKQRDFWGNMNTGRNISSIDSKKIELQNTNNASDLLQASASGVWSSQTSGAPGDHQKVRIRGLSSLFGCSDPLYIIDGVAVPIVNLHSLGIGDLNVNDIEKITILKDAASTALYGYQGANGVVIIDTKRNNESHISFSTKIGVQSLAKKYDLMNTKDFLTALDSAQNNNVAWLRGYYPKYSNSLQSTDWQNVLFRHGVMHEYQLSGSGNIGKTNFYISGCYYTQDGIVSNSSFSRYNIMGNIGRNFTNKISATLNIRSSVQNNNNNLDQYYGNDVILMGINKSPCLNSTSDSLYYNWDQKGHKSNAVRTFKNYTSRAVFGDSITTQKLTSNNENKLNANVSAINLAVKFLILDNLYMNGSSSVTLRNNYFLSDDKYSYPSYAFPYPLEVYYKSSEHYILLNQQLNLNYFKNFNKHEIIFTLGYRNYADNANWNLDSLNSGDNNLFPRDDVYFMRNSLAINSNSGSITRFIQSYAAHLNYNYNKKYFISFIVNHENLKVNDLVNISNWFPSVALNWDISKEPIFNQPGWLNQFNIYANWGQAGNYPVNALAGNFYSTNKYMFNNVVEDGKSVSQFANHLLKSEIANEYNAGTHISLFNSKVQLTADYYTKINSNLVIMQTIPYYYMGGKMMYNIGKISNNGLEFNLELEPINTENFNWYTNFVISFNRQKVLNLGVEKQIHFFSSDLLVPVFTVDESQSLGNITGFKYIGPWTNLDDSLKFYKLTNYNHLFNSHGGKYLKVDSTTTSMNQSDKVVLGKSIPDYTWHWSNTFRYKNFSVDFLWYAVMGVSKFNSTKASTFMAGTNREVTKFMQPRNQTLLDSVFYQSSYFVEDASFIRLKQVTFSYFIPKKVFKYCDIKLSLSFENIVTLTHYSGYDPEASVYTDNSFSDFAVDRGAYPIPRSVYFTIKINL